MPGKTGTALIRITAAVLACTCLCSCVSIRNKPRESGNDWAPQAVRDTRLLLDTRTISIQAEDTPLAGAIFKLEELTGLDVDIAPVLDASVALTLRIKDIVVKNVLNIMAGQAECGWEITGSGAILFREKLPEGMTNDQISRHYYDKGRAAFDEDDYEKARWYFRRAVQFNTDNEDARKMLYETTWMLDSTDRKLSLIMQEREHILKDYEAAKKLFEDGKYEQARKLFEQCLERIRWFPCVSISPWERLEKLSKQAVIECDHRLQEEFLKEKQHKQDR